MQSQVGGGSYVGSELHRQKEEFRQIILSILTVSAKDGITDSELIRDYRSYTGLALPYAQLGYNSVYELMRSMPDVCFIRRHSSKNILLYFPVETEQTRDIARLVRGQKDTNRAVREANRDKEQRRNMYRYHSQQSSTSYNRNHYTDDYFPQQLLSRFPDRAPGDGFVNSTQYLPHGVQNQIRSIFERYDEMTMSELEEIYKIENGFLFNYNKCGFESFASAVQSLTHMLEVVETSSTSKLDPLVRLIKRDAKLLNDHTVPAQNGSSSMAHSQRNTSTQSSSHNGHLSARQDGHRTTSMTEDEVVEVLKKIIDANATGIYPTSLIDGFKSLTKANLDYDRFGYDSFNEFISYRLHGHVGFDYSSPYDEPKIYKLSTRVRGEGSSKAMTPKELDMADKRECLKGIIEKTLTNHRNEPIEKGHFYDLFETINGWQFSPQEYGFNSFEDFLNKFAEEGVFSISFDNQLRTIISYPGTNMINAPRNPLPTSFESSRNDGTGCNETASVIENDGYDAANDPSNPVNRKKIQAEYIQSHIIHTMDPNEILRSFAEKSTHRIIISNVINPANFQIQLVENGRALDSLMDELEKLYYGIGASHYNMPPEYIQHDRLCAAVFDGDKNWHRCRITGYYKEQKSARVQFIDYGGSSTVSINDVKFLAKQFDKLPIQAVNARLHNLAPPVLDTWHKNIVDYMLARVKGRVFSANIIGAIEGVLSIECYQELHVLDKNNKLEINKKSLNQLILEECYAKFYDSTKDIEFKDFKLWQESVFKKYSNRSNVSGITESLTLSENDQQQKSKQLTQSTGSAQSHSPPQQAKPGQAPRPTLTSPVPNHDQSASFEQSCYLVITNETKIKTKQVSIQDNYVDTTYLLLSIDGTLYVYWAQLLELLGIDEKLFKKFIVDRFRLQEEDPTLKCLIVKCEYANSSNQAFFRMLKNWIGVSITEIRRDEGGYLCKYKGIYDLCDLVLHGNHSTMVKSALVNSFKSRSSNDASSSRRDTLNTEAS